MVAGDDVAPAAVVLVLLGQRPHGRPGAVGDLQLGREPDQTAGLADAEVQLPVLGADELLVVPALPLQRLAAEDTEVHRLGGRGPATGVERGVAHADLRRHRGGDGVLPGVLPLGVHDAAHVLRAGLLQEPYGRGDVVRRQHAVAVDADDDGVAGGLDRGVQRGGRPAGGVRHGVHARILGDELGGDLFRTVRGGTDGDHDLHLAGVLLGEDGADGAAQVPLLVEDGHDHGNGGQPHVGLGVHRCSRYRERGTRVRAAGVTAPVSRSYGPTVLTNPTSGLTLHAQGPVPAEVSPCPRRPARPGSRPRPAGALPGRSAPPGRPGVRRSPPYGARSRAGPCGR